MTGLIGVLLLPGIAWLLSVNRAAINWRTIGGAFFLQASLALLVLYVPPGMAALDSIARGVAAVLGYSREGIAFMFGAAVDESFGFVFAFRVLPVIVFFSSLVSVLYHMGIMAWVIRAVGGLLQRVLATSRPESLSAAANILVGQTEAPLVVRPFIPTMTRSELFAVMVGGMASIAGSVMAGYAAIGIELKYLIAACFMAAPGGLMMAKIMIPETEVAREDVDDLGDVEMMSSVNIFDAAASGALTGMNIALAVGAMLVAFIALIAMLNGIIGWGGGLLGYPDLTFQVILGYLFQPLAWAIGVPWSEANLAGSFIGQKLVVNEFIAYFDFINYKDGLSQGTQAIVTFALCGFANFSSIAIMLGGLGAVAPTRRDDIARLGLRALAAATLANLMSAALAGLFLGL
ncbi:MAG TPA: NupC/NupG family nucleoside CNT transporter [Pseudomonadales bacterium]|nr:NupC/NupG family nucleoside CNT transporter [Pseudomonadales bacterium]